MFARKEVNYMIKIMIINIQDSSVRLFIKKKKNKKTSEPFPEKTNKMLRRKQRRRSAVQ